MDYFFDTSAGVNFGGDFDFAPQGVVGGSSILSQSSTATPLPDFSGPSSHLDHHHHHHHQTHASSFSFYGSSDSSHVSATTDDGSRFYSSPLEEFTTSASSVSSSAAALPAVAAAADASSSPPPLTAATHSLPDHVSPSSSSSSSTPSAESPVDADSRRFHDSATVVVVDRRKDDFGPNPEDSSSLGGNSNEASSSSSTTLSSLGLGKSSMTSPSPRSTSSLANIDNANSDSGVVSSSSSTSCGNEHDAAASKDAVPPEEGKEVEEAEPEEEEGEPTIDININNVVCSFSVRCHLNLRKVALEACNTEYNRNRACVKMKLRKPKITASIWNSGKITCIGATSEEDSKIGARRVARILMRMGFNVHFCRFRVVNVLASCTMPFAIRLHTFSAKYPRLVEYEPELHPAATYRIKHPKATLKIFSTGSITITAPHVSHISPSVEHIFPRVQEFRMDEKDKESGEMANLVPKAFVPLNTKHGKIKHIPKGPFHSKFKQVIHQQDLVKKAIQQVKDNESSDEDAMYMGCDDDEADEF